MYERGKSYHGFKLIKESEISEIQSIARVFHHEKSGARLLHLENEDDNKVFSIGFRTPPPDNTGVPHILEHCVLAGSRKYTSKEPFMDMVKGSLQTFINAMTFSDKTLYPVASRNDKDFFNLMDVYLDAVFYPKIYEIPEIFMQEGWHHEIFNKEDNISYKGVVYNEMKGAYSLPETLLSDTISKSLFPDTCYQYSSGGDPDYIPDLSYEDFLDFHRKLYHPSNSYIYLYGNGNLDQQLAHIDEEYLSNFNDMELDSHIERQEAFASMKELVDYYHIGMDDELENKTYLSLNFVLGDNSVLENYLINNIIGEILIGAEAAPLKKALIDAQIGEDIFSTTVGGLQQGLAIIAKNTCMDKKEEFKSLVFDSLRKIVSQGLDKELVEASINKVEYDLRESSGFPTKGIIYNILSMESWLYDGDPISHLQYEDSLRDLREKIDSDYFERFIEEKMINNSHSSLVAIGPKKGLAEEKEKVLLANLEAYKKSLSENELNDLIEDNTKLRELQLSDDTEEAKATIPKLDIADVDKGVEEIPQEIIEEDGLTILYHKIFTSGIAYLDLYFDSSVVEEDHIPYVSLLASLLGKMNTRKKSYGQLSNQIYAQTGGINFTATALIDEREEDSFKPKLIVRAKATEENVDKLMELMTELMVETDLEDTSRIKEILLKMKSRMEMSIFNNGNAVAAGRVGSYFSPYWNYMERLRGLDYYWFVSDLLKDFDSKKGELVAKLKEVYTRLFNRNNLIISFTGDEEAFNQVRNNLKTIKEGLGKEKVEGVLYDLSPEKLNEGILSTSNVQYVSKGYNFKKLGYDYSGSMRVLATLLNGDYLHNRIRAQGGAYGAGISFDRTGHLTTFSYRDPNLNETLAVYDNMAEFISKLKLSETELSQFIIGTIARLEPAMTPYMKGQLAANRYISGLSQADAQEIKDQVLATRLEDLISLAPMLEKAMREDYLCVLGNEGKIKDNEELFKNLVRLIK